MDDKYFEYGNLATGQLRLVRLDGLLKIELASQHEHLALLLPSSSEKELIDWLFPAAAIELPVDKLADDDCHIYLWITNRSLPKGFALLEKWGFRYITTLTWCKPSFGMGNYFRGSTEHVLFGVRGSQPLKRKNVGTWFSAPRGPLGHSSKPVEFYDLVESCSPGPSLEMFARGNRDGWVSWGADANGN